MVYVEINVSNLNNWGDLISSLYRSWWDWWRLNSWVYTQQSNLISWTNSLPYAPSSFPDLNSLILVSTSWMVQTRSCILPLASDRYSFTIRQRPLRLNSGNLGVTGFQLDLTSQFGFVRPMDKFILINPVIIWQGHRMANLRSGNKLWLYDYTQLFIYILDSFQDYIDLLYGCFCFEPEQSHIPSLSPLRRSATPGPYDYFHTIY